MTIKVERIKQLAFRMLIIMLIWVSISTVIQRFKCPEMTETELFLSIPKSVLLDWKSCE